MNEDEEPDELELAYREWEAEGGEIDSPAKKLFLIASEIAGIALFLWAVWYFELERYVRMLVHTLFGW